MKTIKLMSTIMLVACLGLMSCQDEIDMENGNNPNTNSANSQIASNLERTGMYDGSFDDFLDGVSCSSILLPVTATVNGTQVNIISQSDYQQVIDILGEFNNDNDQVVLQFPLTVKLSNYTEVIVTSQGEYDVLIDACEQAEATAQDAISCLDIDYPITILTYSLNLDQTGSVIIESDQQLYDFMSTFSNDELFAVNYPISATLNGETGVTIDSDIDLQSSISDCLATEEAMDDAEEEAANLESILVDGLFQVESFVNAGIDTANDYAEYTIDFANDLTVTAENVVDQFAEDVQGTYEVASQIEVFLNLSFSGNATFELLNQNWEVTSYSQSSISMQSTTNPALTLILSQL
ncbi:MAG: hypothetical protein KJO77_05030 [Bacteroidia bacterium]|nr:hypothetical protein [Bacteroidia bacterium]NND53250.1 hypothetical protein [Flavobacteriaceae bacterium]